jgi:hypothetical protein
MNGGDLRFEFPEAQAPDPQVVSLSFGSKDAAVKVQSTEGAVKRACSGARGFGCARRGGRRRGVRLGRGVAADRSQGLGRRGGLLGRCGRRIVRCSLAEEGADG